MPCYTCKMKSILTLILLLTVGSAQALDHLFYNCEIKNPTLLDSATDEEKQWFLLLGLTTQYIPDNRPAQHAAPSFENQYWQTLAQVRSQVKNCEQALAFWERFGRSIERYFDETPPTHFSLEDLGPSVLSFELGQRQLLRQANGPNARMVVLQMRPPDGLRPWWRASVVDLAPNERQAIAYYSLDRGVLGALTSYEILRQWREQFEFDFWHHDSLINQKQYEVLSATFSWARPLFDLLRWLPERHQLSFYFGYFMLISLLLSALCLLCAAYRDWRHLK